LSPGAYASANLVPARLKNSFRQRLTRMTMKAIYLAPLIGAFIGWLTNYLAVKMLFHPRRAVRFFGFSIQGVFPRRQTEFAEQLGALVAAELLSVQDITRRLSDKVIAEENLDRSLRRLEETAYERLIAQLPLTAVFARANWFAKLGKLFRPDFKRLIQEMISRVNAEVEAEIDVRRMVEEKVRLFSSDKLEELILAIMRRELRVVEVMGGALGFFIGLIQLGLALMPFTIGH